jgi:hypothetical protein
MEMGQNLKNNYKILMNLHRKTTTICRSFALPLHSTYQKANAKHRMGPLASTNHTDNYLVGDKPENDY